MALARSVLRCIQTTSSPQAAAPLLRLWAAISGASGQRRELSSDTLAGLMQRGVPVSVVEFEISTAEAVRRFEDYQRKACMYMHAPSLLRPTTRPSSNEGAASSSGGGGGTSSSDSADGGTVAPTVTPAYLPFWAFSATYSSEARATLGFKDAKTGEMVWKAMADPMALASRTRIPDDDSTMQVYASYTHTRDVADGAAGPGLPSRARPLTEQEAAAGAVGGVALHAAPMRQGVAWQLATRALVHQQLGLAEPAVKAHTKASDVKDLHVSLQVHSRAARLVFLPAYVAVYQYGTRYKQGTSGVIVPHIFTAVVGGTRDAGRVVAPQHVSAAKASLSTGGVVGGLGLLAGDLGSWAPPLLGLEALLPQLGAVEAITLAALAASGAGLWATQRPQTQRSHHAAKQVRADYEFYKKYDMHETYGSGAQDPNRAQPEEGGREEYMLWLWSDADWRRWEHEEPWNWDPEERRKWAEELWRKQVMRRLERQRYVARMAAEAQRRAAEEEAETRRERLYGSSARASHRPRDHGVGGGGAADDEGSEEAGGGRRRRRSDFLGYYSVLGAKGPGLSTKDIANAFKAQAQVLHPDKHVGADAETQRTVLVKFQKLQIAYDTLKDEEKRRLYDRGQLVQ